MWFDIFGTESLTLPGSGWLASATRKQSLLIFRTTESDHCVQGQAGQAATCDQPSPHRVHTQPSQSKQKLLCLFITASVKIPANILSLPHPAIIIQLQQSVCLVMLDLASKGVKLPHTSASV